MCLDLPGRVIGRDADTATVIVDGRIRSATTLLLPDVQVGEWVYVAAGAIVDRLTAESAAQIELEIKQARREIQ
jgi:hydrogenase assembly chaperone HypC/HupF